MKLRLALVLLLVGLFISCEKKAETPGDSLPRTVKGTIGVSLLTLDNPFFKVIGDHITAEGKKHGYETIVVSGEKDVARQSNQVKDFMSYLRR